MTGYSDCATSSQGHSRRPSATSTNTDSFSPTETLSSPLSGFQALSPLGDPTTETESLAASAKISLQGSTSSSTLRGGDSSSVTIQKEIYCILPSESIRYDRGIRIEEHDETVRVDPLFTGYRHKPDPGTWRSYVQAEGQLYFVSQSQRRPGSAPRFITEEYLHNEKDRNELEEFMGLLEEQIHARGDDRGWDKRDIVMEIRKDHWAYYIADHEHRCVMWLESKDLTDLSSSCWGMESLAHLRFAIESDYYVHLERFPHVQELPEGLLEELSGILIHSGIDAITSNESTNAYSISELQQLLAFLKQLQKLHSKGKAKEYVISSAARIMALYSTERFYAFYGVRGAKLGCEMHVRERVDKRTWLIRILSPVLFSAPEVHLKSLEKMWVDKTIKAVPWKTFVDKLEREWSEFVLYSTVLLNANVAFLAIPVVINNNNNMTTVINNSTITIDPSSDQNNDPLSPAAVANLLSILTSLCSIVVGLILSRQHRSKAKESAFEAATYLLRRTYAVVGLETLAITYSLPYSMLMWSMVTFITSVGITCFSVPGNIQPIIFTVAWFFVVALVLWTVVTGWETNTQSNWRDLRVFRVFEPFKRLLRRGEDGSSSEADGANNRALFRRPFGRRLKWKGPSLKGKSFLRRRQLPQTTPALPLPARRSTSQRSSSTSLPMFHLNNSHSNVSIHSSRTDRR